MNPEQYGPGGGAWLLSHITMHWQQWVTLGMWVLTVLTIPLKETALGKIVFALGCFFGFYVLWSGGWYTGGTIP